MGALRVDGTGVTYFGRAPTATSRRAVDEFGAPAIGEDPLRPAAIAEKLAAAIGGYGPGGIFTMALSAIDMALWDIKGKSLNLPLWKLLDGGRDRLATYASGACVAASSSKKRSRSRAGAVDPRGGRPRHGFDVRRQAALGGRAGDRHRQACRGRRRGPVLARGCDDGGRFYRARRGRRRAVDPGGGGEYLWCIALFRHMLEARSTS